MDENIQKLRKEVHIIMKKLLIIAILMLALVFTVVACNNEPVVDETTADTTVDENPTEAPTDEQLGRAFV